MTNSIDELKDADVIFVIGSNTTEQHPLVAMKIIEAVRKGAKLIVVDPRRIPLANYSTIYAPIKPGTNLALINGILNVIVNQGLENKEFIQSRTEGFDEFKDAINKYTPEIASNITGVSKDIIIKIAQSFALANNATIVYAMGITQHISGTANVAALANLALLTGNIGKPSSGVNPLRGQGNVQGSCDMGALPDSFPGYQKIENEQVADKFKCYWGENFAKQRGMTLKEMFDGIDNGKIKALYIIGENPVITDPDSEHVKRALEKLDLLIVQDIFPTETAYYADIILPAASFIEKDGTFTNTERRVQRVRKAIEPIGNSRADWCILNDLIYSFREETKELNLYRSYDSPSEIMDEIRELVPSYYGISYDRLELGGLQWPCTSLDHPGTKVLHENTFSRGLGKFTVNEYEASTQISSEEYPLILTNGRVQHHYHSGTMTRRAWALEREYPNGFVEINPSDADQYGIKNGALVKVISKNGEVTCHALVTDSISEGVVFIPFHYSEVPVNKLIGKNHDPIVHIPEFKVCTVRIEVTK